MIKPLRDFTPEDIQNMEEARELLARVYEDTGLNYIDNNQAAVEKFGWKIPDRFGSIIPILDETIHEIKVRNGMSPKPERRIVP